jgi:predicted MFS family arabinose efflux permease
VTIAWRHLQSALRPPPRDVAPRRLIVLLAAAMALESCDQGTVGATATLLHDNLGLSSARIGLLASASALIGALATVPMGVLADRVDRVRLLMWAVITWSMAMVLVGATDTFWWMMVARVGLGVVTAVAGPVSASLIGDTVAEGQRGQVFSFLLAGELAGTGLGLVVSGEVAGLAGWRWAYWWLVLPGLGLAWALRQVPEPSRAGSAGTVHERDALATDVVRRAGIEPDEKLLLREDPRQMNLVQAARYVFRIKTNVVLVVASVVAYYFFTGLRTFAATYLHDQYHLAQTSLSLIFPVLGIGAFVGVLSGGVTSDRLLRRGVATARVRAVLIAYFAALVLLVPGIAVNTLLLGLPLLVLAAAALGAANPPLDAARIDIMPPELLGRAEALRSLLRNSADASAPAVFGFTSAAIGMRATMLVMLIPMLAGGLLGLIALRTYPRDVATASANARRSFPAAAGREPPA